MFDFFRERENKKRQMDSLLLLKRTLERQRAEYPTEAYEEIEGVKQKLDNIFAKLTDLDRKIERIDKDKISKLADDISFKLDKSRNRPDGVRKRKVKNMIYALITEHKRLTAFDLSKMLNMSRTRCSEYLKELERAGILTGVTNCRKRYYEIRR